MRAGRCETWKSCRTARVMGAKSAILHGARSSAGAMIWTSCAFGRTFKNISGATRSSEQVTEGVRWLMALWQATLGPLPHWLLCKRQDPPRYG